MYSIYRSLQRPSGVEQAISCNLISPAEKCLVTSCTNQINIYRLLRVPAAQGDSSISGKGNDSKAPASQKEKLENVLSVSLFGNVVNMASVRLPGMVRDALLLSFADAKLSLVEYDVATHDLRTMSMHFFEDEEMTNGYSRNIHLPQLRVDWEFRCAAMLIYGNKLVILPFGGDTRLDSSISSKVESTAKETESTFQQGAYGSGQILSSYIINTKRDLDADIRNIKDFQFLHGYFEPTIFILYEPLPTSSGRIAIRKDTCSFAALSLNISQHVHPIIWSLDNLPFDCFGILPIPKPIGGVLVKAVNSLLYFNQSVPPYAVALNSIGKATTWFPLREQELNVTSTCGNCITLDCSQWALVSPDKVFLSLKGGEVILVTLIVDVLHTVRAFRFEKIAASVLTSCLCLSWDCFLFLGSWLGNSLLLKYREKTVTSAPNRGEPANKKARLEETEPELDELELEVYGRSLVDDDKSSCDEAVSYSFEVCDSLLNIGPCSYGVMGEPSFVSEEYPSLGLESEVLLASGCGKNGSVCVIQQTVKPQVVTTFHLPGCTDMWTVYNSQVLSTEEGEEKQGESAEASAADATDEHGFLILSREDSSMVLKTGAEIMEIDHGGFTTQAPTIYAGNIGGKKYIVQVSRAGVTLLQGVRQIQHVPVDIGSPVVFCSVADPYVVILSEEGQVRMLALRDNTEKPDEAPRLAISKPPLQRHGQVITLCVYRDCSGLFSTTSSSDDEKFGAVATRGIPDSRVSARKTAAEEEEELLYGEEGDQDAPMAGMEDDVREKNKEIRHDAEGLVPTYWTVMSRKSGLLEIYELPNWQLRFQVKNFPMALVLLNNSSTSGVGTDAPDDHTLTNLPNVKELLLIGLGYQGKRVILFARINEEIVIYEAFSYFGQPEDGQKKTKDGEFLKIRFRKVSHDMIISESRTARQRREEEEMADEVAGLEHSKKLLMKGFTDIAGYSGVFISGSHPYWVFMNPSGVLRTHPMVIDGEVTCFTPFHNVNCPKGFLYFNKQEELRICVLPSHLSYDFAWPVRKIPLRSSVTAITYHLESKLYVLSLAQQQINKSITVIKVEGDGQKEFEDVERPPDFPFPLTDIFSLHLFSPDTWQVISHTKHPMERFESILALQTVPLRSTETVSGLKGYIAVGTNCTHGEDIASRGRILLFDIKDVVPEPGQPLTKHKLKLVCEKEATDKGPVSAISHVHGYLATAIGQKVYLWEFKDNGLQPIAFIDTDIYIHQMCSLKSFILIADFCKSITLLRFNDELQMIYRVSRDVTPMETYSVGFSVDSTQLGFIVTDNFCNLFIYDYQAEARESAGGTRLLRKADFNTGAKCVTMWRIKCRTAEFTQDKKMMNIVANRHVTFLGLLDGRIGRLLPMKEQAYRRLLMLQNTLITHAPQVAGLNPKSYTQVVSAFPSLQNPCKNILDGDLIWRYLYMSSVDRQELAKRIGTTMEQIVDDFADIDRMSMVF